ncbi:MAG: hypothetical protein ACM3ST_12240 [Bdellovibrio bacteriovorus]
MTVGLLGVETKATASRPLTPHVAITVVEAKPLEADRIAVVETSAMEQALERDGRIAIHGIDFDFDRAQNKPKSEPQTEQPLALPAAGQGRG